MDAMDAGARHATRDASDRLLKAIVENLNGGVSVVVYDEDGGVRHAYKNDRYYEMFGYTPEQFAAEKNAPYAIVVPEDARYVRDTMARVRETGKPASFQYRARKRDGREIFVACHTSVASVEDINETLLLSVMTDITELIETNEQLEAERERIDDLMNTAPGGIAVVQVDPENVPGGIHTLFYNDSFYSFSGYSREEYDALLRENEMHFVFDEDVQTLIDATRAICAGEARKPVDSIVRCRTKDGGYRWLLLTGQLVSRRGSLCDITVVLVDITERKNAEDRQRISGDMLRIAAETDKRTIITYDVKANTCHFESRNLYSAKYGEMLEDVPQSLIDVGIVAQESTADVCALFERIRRGDMTAHASLLLRTGNQEYQWFECNASAVLDADGCPDHAVLVLHNITEQRVKEAVYRKWRNSMFTKQDRYQDLLTILAALAFMSLVFSAFVARRISMQTASPVAAPRTRVGLLAPSAIRPGIVLVLCAFAMASVNSYVLLYANTLQFASPSLFFVFSALSTAVSRLLGGAIGRKLGVDTVMMAALTRRQRVYGDLAMRVVGREDVHGVNRGICQQFMVINANQGVARAILRGGFPRAFRNKIAKCDHLYIRLKRHPGEVLREGYAAAAYETNLEFPVFHDSTSLCSMML